jgi:hypothetical protein
MKSYVHWRLYLTHFFLEWEMFQTEVAEKIKTHILCSITFFDNSADYEIMWKNSVEPGRTHENIIWRMHTACWIPKATNTHPLYVTNFCFSTATMVARTRLNVTLYVHCCLVYNRDAALLLRGMNWVYKENRLSSSLTLWRRNFFHKFYI